MKLLKSSIHTLLLEIAIVVNAGCSSTNMQSPPALIEQRRRIASAITSKNQDELLRELSRGANPRDSWNGDPLIEIAANCDYFEGVKLLLLYGANPNDRGISDKSPLIAASGGHADVVQLLIDYGAKVNYANRDGMTALMVAAWGPASDAMKCETGIPKETDWEARDERAQHLKVVRILVNAGAFINAKNRWGETAVDIASNTGQVEILEFLKAQRVKVHKRGR